MELTAQQVRFFRDVGYLRLPGLVDKALVGQLYGFLRAESEREVLSRNLPVNGKYYQLFQRNPNLVERLIRHSTIVEPLRSLLGNNIVFLANRHNHATTNSGSFASAPRLHRDVLQWSRSLVTVLVYLQDSRIENGCTQVVPGSHHLPFTKLPGQGGGTWMDEHAEFRDLLDQAVPVPMEKGSVLAIDATTFHCVGENRSSRTRASITLAYRSVDELDFGPDLHRTILVSGEYIYRGNDG